MNHIHLQLLDLNLLKVFDALYEERSVRRAAERLKLTPSAVSHALNRLRGIIGDDLFVRGQGGMLRTPQAENIGPRIRNALLELEQAFLPSTFDPAKSSRRFTLSASPYVCWTILPRLMKRFLKEAPKAYLEVKRRNTHLVEDLDLRRVDLVIGTFSELPDRVATTRLLRDSFVWVMSADNPQARGPLTREKLAQLTHVLVSVRETALKRAYQPDTPDERGQPMFSASQSASGGERLKVLDAMSALAVAGVSDVAAFAPRRLVEMVAKLYNLSIFDPPHPTEELEFHLAWHTVHGADPGTVWLRDLLCAVAAEELS